MKKILILFLIFPLFIVSCKKKPGPPVADFVMEVNGDPEVGREVYFINKSKNAVSFDWNFGDGYGSAEENPVYIYNSNGVFTVTLTARGEGGGTSTSTLTVEVLIPTLLVVEVVEYYDEMLIPDAEVRLYESLVDWDKGNENWLFIGVTDEFGTVVFSGLGAYVYYVDAFQGYNTPNGYDNYTLRGEDEGFIRTNTVIPNRINWFTAWVDAANHTGTKGVARSKDVIIKKLERKPDEQVMRNLGVDGWKDLYERSLKNK